MDEQTIASWITGGGLISMLSVAFWNQRQATADQKVRGDALQNELSEERRSCTERIQGIEDRMDRERVRCQSEIEELRTRLESVERVARRISPESFRPPQAGGE